MFYETTKRYISELQEHLISNDILFSFLSLIEILPIIYQSVMSSLYLSSSNKPKYAEQLKYMSFYDKFTDLFDKVYSISFIIIVIILLLIFILYKYIFLPYLYRPVTFLHKIIINVYEIFIFKVFAIIILDIEINLFVSSSLFYSIISLLILIITVFGLMYHYSSNFIYIKSRPNKLFFFDNKMFIIYQKYYTVTKIIICFIKSSQKINVDSKIETALHVILISINILILIRQVYLLLTNKFTFITNNIYILLYFSLNVTTIFIQVLLIVVNVLCSFFFVLFIVFFFINVITLIFRIKRQYKLTILNGKDNFLSAMVFMLKGYPYKSESVYLLIDEFITGHKSYCNSKKCKFCLKIKEKINFEDTNENNISNFYWCLFHCLIKNKEFEINQQSSEYSSYYYIIEFYFFFFSKKKSLIKTFLKYNELKSRQKFFSKKKSFSFSQNFFINLDLLFEKILSKKKENVKFNPVCLIKIDVLSKKIKIFLKYLDNFFKNKVYTPKEIFKLSEIFSNLHKKENFEILHAKDNKFNYTCLLSGFILEEIFKEPLSQGITFKELINSIDDVIDNKYHEDCTLLALFDVPLSSIIIKQCGNQLNYLRGKNIEKIFPSYLANDGKRKFLETITHGSGIFEYYLQRKYKNTIEIIKIKFVGVPTLDKNKNKIYLSCNYKIEKGNFIVFQKQNNIQEKKILFQLSDVVTTYLQISPEVIESSIQKKQYIYKSDICSNNDQIINIKHIKEYREKVLHLKKLNFVKAKNLKISLLEIINRYEIYQVEEPHDGTGAVETIGTKCPGLNNITKIETLPFENEVIDLHFTTTQTGMSSSTLTRTTHTSVINSIKRSQEQQKLKFRHFSYYTYLVLCCCFSVGITLIVFLVVELKNNAKLKKIFTVIVDFYDFQTYFYLSALSLFSLTCNADYPGQVNCSNQFVSFSKEKIIKYQLKENQMIYDYITRELDFKTDAIISSLQSWEKNNYLITSDSITKILKENFTFDSVEELEDSIRTTKIILTFNDAIKRYVNIISSLSSMDSFLTSSIYTITFNEDETIDFSSLLGGGKLNDGSYLNIAQKYYYNFLINFQKYLQKLLRISENLSIFYENLISKTSFIILIFILVFVFMHLLMYALCIILLIKFKEIHIFFYLKIYDKLNDPNFVRYCKSVYEVIQKLLAFYKENPTSLILKIEKIQEKEKNRIKNILQENKTKTEGQSIEMLTNSCSKKTLNLDNISKNYNEILILKYIFKLGIQMAWYFLILMIIYFVLYSKINNLSKMNNYTKVNYDASNLVYINIALVQLMSLTNQTDKMLNDYFNAENETYNKNGTKGYIRQNIEKAFSYISELESLEKHNSFFHSIYELIDIDCEDFYQQINDPFIIQMTEKYPQNDYYYLFSQYCKQAYSINLYQNTFLTLQLICYSTSSLLDLFVGRTYKIYAVINNSEILYQKYADLLMMVRPMRRYIYHYLVNDVIVLIISEYNLFMIIFIIFNFIYEAFILGIIKYYVINNIINYSKQVIIVSKAFECFS